MRLVWNLTFKAALAAGVCLVLLGATAAGLVLKVRAELADGRAGFAARTLGDAVEANLSLGFPIGELSAVQGLIEREKLRDPRFLLIDVFAADGAVLYSTDRASVGETVGPPLRAAIVRPAPWRVEGPRSVVVGAPVENDFGQIVGAVAVTASVEPIGARVAAALADVAPAALIALFAAAAAAAGWAALLMRPSLNAARSLDVVASTMVGETPRTSGAADSAAIALAAAAAAAAGALAQAQDRAQELDDAA